MSAQKKLMIGSAVYSTLFAITAFIVMFYHASHKQILIQDVAQDAGTELVLYKGGNASLSSKRSP